MNRDIVACQSLILSGLRGLNLLEERLYWGDLDGAADSIKTAWSAVTEPIEYLSQCWDGLFWDDWRDRDHLFHNIGLARNLLQDGQATDLEVILMELKDLLRANLLLLNDAVTILGADTGMAPSPNH